MSIARATTGKTVAEFLTAAIDEHLPQIVADLEAIGVPAKISDSARPARLPMDPRLIAILNSAAKVTGIPTTRLLAACIQRASRSQE
jgi:hypothetical protein